ncbi:MAG: hypothetical protein DRP74_09315 [Candidatus Omnitrophota bacterium]|nr:MAG: hypothetical protein DRP74_09315 [Candidatus Omnitrophota bacterium]
MTQKPQIKFTHNWNGKLNQEFFTTIRRFTKDKEQYYFNHLGDVFDVILNGKKICEAKLIHIETMEYRELPKGFVIIDTGNEDPDNFFYEEFGIYGKMDVLILTFRRVKK